ncbi:MAG: phage holin family protein [Bacteroidetes bacterium]|nr:phage holin family protein [Bacteroidota bacterium]
MKFITRILISALSVMIVATLLKGVHINNFGTALLVAIVLAFLNTFLKPLLTILTIPITIFTLGLFLLFLNALMIILAGKLVNGFSVDGIGWALLFSVILSFITSILNSLIGVKEG